MSIDNLPSIKDMIDENNVFPKKSMGQNFLFDLNLTNKIASFIPDIKNQTVLEIGPGPGGLTRSLLLYGVKKLIVIEKDISLKPILEKIKEFYEDRLEIIFSDAIDVLNTKDFFNESISVCANLPYNIGTEIFIKLLHIVYDNPHLIKSMTLMFQTEVAERIISKPNSKIYGRLSILSSLLTDSKILFNIPNSAFYPSPKVQSSVVGIYPNLDKIKKIDNLEKIEKITSFLFGQRRKMIRSIFKDFDFEKNGFDGTKRAENLEPEDFIKLSKFISL